MVSASNVIRVFKEFGLRAGVRHILRSTGNLLKYAFQVFLRSTLRLMRSGKSGKTLYLTMQRNEYNLWARGWSPVNRDPVVGSWDQQNTFPDYDKFLFSGIDTEDMRALEYGCGPGRNIEKYSAHFRQLDGVDISSRNITKAKKYLATKGIVNSILWSNDGQSIAVPTGTYDLVFSVITLQHIASYSIRASIFEEIFNALAPGGVFTFQMGYGGRENSVGYFEDDYEAYSTNGMRDVSVTSEEQLTQDLSRIGYEDFRVNFGPTCNDLHKMWIWVQARKPVQ
jgi:SAM-dependent methyltransferase